jgi:hypothetical protein
MPRRSGDSHFVPETPESVANTHHLPACTPPETAAPGAATRLVLRLSLLGTVLFAVMAATLANAGSGKLNSSLQTTFSGSKTVASLAASSAHIAENVQPIIQADVDAGYDSRQQHDTWWDSACSAASFTEIMHAWGQKDVTIGHVIDEMSAHNPPYITPWGGLMTSDAWPFIANLHHFNADVQFHQVNYDALVHITMQQGLPVIVGVRDYTGRYYPALSGGHFLVVVGGDQTGLRIVDSSLYRISYLPRDEFTHLWDSGSDLTVLLTPA